MFNQLQTLILTGLMTHDVVRGDHAVYKEAVAMLPADITEARQMRISKAFQYDGSHRLAPETDWINENTVMNLFITKHL